ncbi:STM4014 family protein [Catellatospora sichuanensis]|uniref:STM4014 family protein n=1 Tax=Catellatospora sichuanensis TaxID=1969805 RepID=UPI001182127F|nr:STM4014 family protein [Catellatospora sichuanensis]
MHLTVVGNPGHRRVTLFTAAAVRAGLAEPEVVSWQDVLTGVPLRLRPGTVVRVESPGEDAEVDRLLRGAGRTAEPGEIVGGRAWYTGFAAALDRVADAARDQGAHLLADPAEILVMFDKAACHARLLAAGIPVPAALPRSPASWAQLRSWLDETGWRRVFVKPCHGSSASGVIALQLGSGGRILATTSVELSGGRLYNSLRVRHYRDERDVAAIVDRLAPDGLQVQRWLPKAGLDGRVVDLRVVTVAGEPSHVVVRGSRSPMTNLHLGGVREDLCALRAAAGRHYAEGLATCRAVAACFPGSLHTGVDLMFAAGWRSHAVAEVNAFGDLLPGLHVDGRDTYDAEVAALLTRERAGAPA